MQVIEPYIIKTLIPNTFSAIPERGIHLCLNRVRKAIKEDRDGCEYCLKIDVRHFYPSVNHETLKQKYRRLFKDADLLWLIDEIIDSISTASVEDLERINRVCGVDENNSEVGIPIGNYISQYSGNFYLSSFDHWVKENKHMKHYFRYMDDIVILSGSKEELHKLKDEIDEYLKVNLRLTLKDNWQVFPTYARGIDFVGYRIFEDYVLLRKTTCENMKKKMTTLLTMCKNGVELDFSDICCINSHLGWMKPCDSFRLREAYIKPLEKYVYNYYHKERLKKQERKESEYEEILSELMYEVLME